MWALNVSIRGAYWFISAIALRIGASETLSSPAKGWFSSKIRKMAPETDSAHATMTA